MPVDRKYILHIDTASDRGMVMLAYDENIVAVRLNTEPMQHAAFVQPAIAAVMQEAGIYSTQIKAVAVANGPGSYTGLRVGLAAAKGICFAWSLPLITLSSLQIMAKAVQGANSINFASDQGVEVLYAALIDARRMEVFYAVFNQDISAFLEGPKAAEVDQSFLKDYFSIRHLVCTGNGCRKWLNLLDSEKVSYTELPSTELAFAKLAKDAYDKHDFADLAYSEPFYTKSFYSTVKMA